MYSIFIQKRKIEKEKLKKKKEYSRNKTKKCKPFLPCIQASSSSSMSVYWLLKYRRNSFNKRQYEICWFLRHGCSLCILPFDWKKVFRGSLLSIHTVSWRCWWSTPCLFGGLPISWYRQTFINPFFLFFYKKKGKDHTSMRRWGNPMVPI